MKMIDMKRPAPKKEKGGGAGKVPMPPAVGGREERPYCMRFTFEAEELKAMGMKPSDFAGMKPMMMTMEVEPITIRDIQNKGADEYDKQRNQSVEFQIMKVGKPETMLKKKMGSDMMNDFKGENEKGPGE